MFISRRKFFKIVKVLPFLYIIREIKHSARGLDAKKSALLASRPRAEEKFGEFTLFEHWAKQFGELIDQPKEY